MRAIHYVGAVMLLLGAGELLAQNCPNGQRLTQNQIKDQLANNNWWCAQKVANDPNNMWREYLPNASTGTFKECHSGLSSGPDPIDNNKGIFTVAGGSDPDKDPGTIKFDYGTGGSYTYWVCGTTPNFVFRLVGDANNSAANFPVVRSDCPTTGISNAQKTSCP